VNGARCLVTGATSGIGEAIAYALAARGAALVVTGRDEERLDALERSLGARPVRCDLTEPGAIGELAQAAGPVDVLVHAAGAGQYGRFVDVHPLQLEQLVALNVTAPMALTAALLPGMLQRGTGHVVLVGSIAGRLGRGRESVYAATKGAVALFADSLRAELAGTNIGVLLVTPGPVDTPFFARRGAPYDRAWPRPVSAARVAAATVDALERNRTEVTVPRWLSVPVRLRGAAPVLYRALAERFD